MNEMSTTDIDGEGPPKAKAQSIDVDGSPQDEEEEAYAEADDIHEVSPTPSPKRSSSDSDEDSDSSDDSELDRMFAGGGDNDGGDVTASDAVTSEDKNKNEAAVRAAIASKFTVPTATSPTSTTSTTINNNNNNNNNITKQLSANWGLVKQAVAVNTTPKDDLWSAIKEAIGESKEDETHRNDKNDTNSSFTFKNFRRELSMIRRSSMESENGSPWTGEDSEKSLWSAGSGDGSYDYHDEDDDDDDDDEQHYEEELPIFASVKRVGRRLDRKKSLVQSIRRTALTSSTLSSMSGSASFTDFLKLTNDEAAKEWA